MRRHLNEPDIGYAVLSRGSGPLVGGLDDRFGADGHGGFYGHGFTKGCGGECGNCLRIHFYTPPPTFCRHPDARAPLLIIPIIPATSPRRPASVAVFAITAREPGRQL